MISKVFKKGVGGKYKVNGKYHYTNKNGNMQATEQLCKYLLDEESHNSDYSQDRNLYVDAHNIKPIFPNNKQPFQYEAEDVNVQLQQSRSKAKNSKRHLQSYHFIFSFSTQDFPIIPKTDPNFKSKRAKEARQATKLVKGYMKERLGKYWKNAQLLFACQQDGKGLTDENNNHIAGTGSKLHVHVLLNAFTLDHGKVIDDNLCWQEDRVLHKRGKTIYIEGVKKSSTEYMKKMFPIICHRQYQEVQPKQDLGTPKQSNEYFINHKRSNKEIIKSVIKDAISHAKNMDEFKALCAKKNVTVIDRNQKGNKFYRKLYDENGNTKGKRQAFTYGITYMNKRGKTVTKHIKDFAISKRGKGKKTGLGIDTTPDAIKTRLAKSLKLRQEAKLRKEQEEKQKRAEAKAKQIEQAQAQEAKQEINKPVQSAPKKTPEQPKKPKATIEPNQAKTAPKPAKQAPKQDNVVDITDQIKANQQQTSTINKAKEQEHKMTPEQRRKAVAQIKNMGSPSVRNEIQEEAKQHSDDIGTPEMEDFKINNPKDITVDDDDKEEQTTAPKDEDKTLSPLQLRQIELNNLQQEHISTLTREQYEKLHLNREEFRKEYGAKKQNKIYELIQRVKNSKFVQKIANSRIIQNKLVQAFANKFNIHLAPAKPELIEYNDNVDYEKVLESQFRQSKIKRQQKQATIERQQISTKRQNRPLSTPTVKKPIIKPIVGRDINDFIKNHVQKDEISRLAKKQNLDSSIINYNLNHVDSDSSNMKLPFYKDKKGAMHNQQNFYNTIKKIVNHNNIKYSSYKFDSDKFKFTGIDSYESSTEEDKLISNVINPLLDRARTQTKDSQGKVNGYQVVINEVKHKPSKQELKLKEKILPLVARAYGKQEEYKYDNHKGIYNDIINHTTDLLIHDTHDYKSVDDLENHLKKDIEWRNKDEQHNLKLDYEKQQQAQQQMEAQIKKQLDNIKKQKHSLGLDIDD